MQPLIAPLYDAHSAHEMLGDADERSRAARTLDIVKDYWTRALRAAPAAGRSRTRDGETFGNADAFWKQVAPRRLHSRHGDRGGRTGDTVQAAPDGAGMPAAAAASSRRA